MNSQSEDKRTWSRRIRSALPIVGWLPGYQRSWLRPDIVAGLTLAAYAVPVSVAYASLAGLPPKLVYSAIWWEESHTQFSEPHDS